ncbi:MAG: GNAT family N-acetyltransferase [Bdellovibrionales bacterium]
MFSSTQSPSCKDLKDIAYLYCQAFNAPDKGENWTHESAMHYFQENTDDTSVFGLHHDQDKAINAFIFGGDSGEGKERTFYLSQFVVSEDLRGKGIGRQLLNFITEFVLASHYRSIIVRCRANNDSMISLLLSEGYEIFKRYDDSFGGVMCERLMFRKSV